MQVRKLFFYSLSILAILLVFEQNSFAAKTNWLESESGQSKGAKVRIIASYYNKSDGTKQLIIAPHFKISDGWKIYGPDDSGFGQPPSFDFLNSTNLDKKNFINWPSPIMEEEKIGSETIKYTTYKNEVLIPIEASHINAEQNISLSLKINYGLCKEICIPVTQYFNLNIPASEYDPESLAIIQDFIKDKEIISDEEIDQFYANNPTKDSKLALSLKAALIIAFIGGLILNIMPCVLPVISIKLLSIIEHSGAEVARIRKAYLATFVGIIFSFLSFAIATIFLKNLGNSLGWGLQFQNPYFLIFLVLILMIFASNLIGLFEISFNSFLAGILDKKISNEEKKHNVFIPNFLSGILAVLLATPCSAPFLGTAISFALSSGPKEILLIFITMGIGLGFPYVILFLIPKATKMLPRPGSWMIRVKNLMAGFLLATVVWLIYVLSDNIGYFPAIILGIFAISILAFFRFAPKIKSSLIKVLIFLAIIFAAIFVPTGLSSSFKIAEHKNDQIWVKFDKKQIRQLVRSGKTVIIDITADWCITCKANKILVLNSKEVTEKLQDSNVVAMRGDITKPDPEIMEFLKTHNRYAIPFNMVYGPAAPDGIVTSELLNKEKLLEIIDKASEK